MLAEWPNALAKVDFARVRFYLEFQSPCSIEPVCSLGLRRGFSLALLRIKDTFEHGEQRLRNLLDPPLSFDPVAVKKYQKPAAPFVIVPLTEKRLKVDVGDLVPIEVLFLGQGIHRIEDFFRILEALGPLGIQRGEGIFEISHVESLGLIGSVQTLWRQQSRSLPFTPEVFTAEAYLQHVMSYGTQYILQFETPTRLIKSGRLLKSPSFKELFPFIMRRVTALLYTHSLVELVDDPQKLTELSCRVTESSFCWQWSDWRVVGGHNQDKIGGIVGNLKISGPEVDALLWIISLASLVGIGKGATYGAGHFSLIPV